jgi:hypothetical protein
VRACPCVRWLMPALTLENRVLTLSKVVPLNLSLRGPNGVRGMRHVSLPRRRHCVPCGTCFALHTTARLQSLAWSWDVSPGWCVCVCVCVCVPALTRENNFCRADSNMVAKAVRGKRCTRLRTHVLTHTRQRSGGCTLLNGRNALHTCAFV